MNRNLWNHCLALAAASSVAALITVGLGCGRDVTSGPEGAVASNTEESSTKSALSSQEPVKEDAVQPEDRPQAQDSQKSPDGQAKEPEKSNSGSKTRGPGIVPTPMPPGGPGAPNAGGDQGERRPGGMMRGTQRMLEQLNLTDAQKEKIKAITEEAAKQFQALRESQEAQQGSLREKFQQIREGMMKKIEAVLTAEQRAKLKKLQEEAAAQMRERMREREQGGQGGPGGGNSQQGKPAPGGTRGA
jgi:Spy/CpxP family protein refolding chaperone